MAGESGDGPSPGGASGGGKGWLDGRERLSPEAVAEASEQVRSERDAKEETDVLSDIGADFVSRFEVAAGAGWESLRAGMSAAIAVVTNVPRRVTRAVTAAVTGAVRSVQGALTRTWAAILGAVFGVLFGIRNAFLAVVGGIIHVIRRTVGGIVTAIRQIARTTGQAIVSGVATIVAVPLRATRRLFSNISRLGGTILTAATGVSRAIRPGSVRTKVSDFTAGHQWNTRVWAILRTGKGGVVALLTFPLTAMTWVVGGVVQPTSNRRLGVAVTAVGIVAAATLILFPPAGLPLGNVDGPGGPAAAGNTTDAPTPTETPPPTETSEPTETSQPSASPAPTETPPPSPTPSPTPTASPMPTPTPTPTATATPTPTPTSTPSPTPTPTPAPEPTDTPCNPVCL